MSQFSEQHTSGGAGWGLLVLVFNLATLVALGRGFSPKMGLNALMVLGVMEFALGIFYLGMGHSLRAKSLFFGLAFTAVAAVLSMLIFVGLCAVHAKDLGI